MQNSAKANSGRRWVVTGGCGFIGGALLRRLIAGGHDVRVVDDLSVGSRAVLAETAAFREAPAQDFGDDWDGLQFVRASVLDADAAVAASVGADAIVHLAANTGVGPSVELPRQDCEINILGTLNYLEAARANNVQRFVFPSSGAPLGKQEPPLNEELAPHPMSPYGASKLAGEGYCSAYFHSYGVETVALRFGNVYGPGSAHKESVVAKFLRRALAGETLEIYGDGQQTRDFIYVEDIVDAILRAQSEDGIGGELFQIATGRERTVYEVTELIAEILRKRLDLSVDIYHGPVRVGDAQRNYSDTSKAEEMLGFAARMDIETGITNTLEYLLQQVPNSHRDGSEGECLATKKSMA